ncbi:MAG: DUF2148 domain-containing protein [Methanospirillum sp.]
MNDESRAARMVCDLMALSARTAPKAGGEDSLVVRSVADDDLDRLAGAMRGVTERGGSPIFHRDAGNVSASEACLLLGVRGGEAYGLDCGGCGYASCGAMREAAVAEGTPYGGPNCVLKVTDLGIAVGSAVKTASLLNLDNRVMYTAGVAALSLGWLPDCTVGYGIPVSATGKSVYFDRAGRR